jgi:hypothetical protein
VTVGVHLNFTRGFGVLGLGGSGDEMMNDEDVSKVDGRKVRLDFRDGGGYDFRRGGLSFL